MLTRFFHPQRLRPERLLTVVFPLALLLAVTPPASAEVTPDDPVVADVVRMLDAGLEPRLVRSWLDSSSKRPGPLSANDMIALASANAPDELIGHLLESAMRPAEAEAPLPSAPPVATASRETPPVADAPRLPAAKVDGIDCCLVDFSVEYRAPEVGVDEDADLPRADLYLYIDGQFAGRFEARGDLASRGPQLFKRQLAPGEHRIRLTRELHLPSKNRDAAGTRDHNTAVSPSIIEFSVQAGAQWNMDIRWTQGVFSRKRPLSWRWSKNGARVSGADKVGAPQDDWPFLCDDVEISRVSGAISDWRAKDRSRNCVTWASLWPRGVEIKRADLLQELRRVDFRPAVESSMAID